MPSEPVNRKYKGLNLPKKALVFIVPFPLPSQPPLKRAPPESVPVRESVSKSVYNLPSNAVGTGATEGSVFDVRHS